MDIFLEEKINSNYQKIIELETNITAIQTKLVELTDIVHILQLRNEKKLINKK